MAQAASQPIEQVRSDLARALRSLRSDCAPHETARQLLEYDHPGHTVLIGLDFEGSKAVLYHEVDRYAISIRFGPDGLAEGGTEIASFRDGTGLRTWIKKMRLYWGWLHPRYR
jgi:hypothetical protein